MSVFGPEKGDLSPNLNPPNLTPPDRTPPHPIPLTRVNVHVDLIDWRGTRGGRDAAALIADLLARLAVAAQTGAPVGFMTHHLVHDAAAWQFVDRLFAVTAHHPGSRWHRLSDLLPARQIAVT